MPTITSTPPKYVRAERAALRHALTREIPVRGEENLLIATWNIRAMGRVTKKWTARQSDSPKRDLRGLMAIAEIISRFDVVAIQEVGSDVTAIKELVRYLGGDWSFLMTDVNYDDVGNDERMAFVFDRSRVTPSGLAAEIVVPPEWLADPTQIALREQFARPPYAVSFSRRSEAIILTTVHIKYGKEEVQRVPELQSFAQWMSRWAGRAKRLHQNLLALGDFNVDRFGSPGYEALLSEGLEIPIDLLDWPRTLTANPDDPQADKFYDQIAWFSDGRSRRLTLEHVRSGSFDFLPLLYQNTKLTATQVSWRISDHYPLWVEFQV